jgi:hypothetical protein
LTSGDLIVTTVFDRDDIMGTGIIVEQPVNADLIWQYVPRGGRFASVLDRLEPFHHITEDWNVVSVYRQR